MAEAKLDTLIRREQIAAAALELVASEGVARLSVAAVARRVGLVPSGIYRHFRSKDQVLDAVLELLEKKLMANVELARQQSPEPLERLRRLLRLHVRFIREGRAFPRIVFSDEALSGHPERTATVRRIVAGYLGAIEEIVRDGQRLGCVTRGIVPRTAAMMFLGMVVPAGIVWHLSDGDFNVTQHAGRAWQMFRRAIAAEAGTVKTRSHKS